MNNLQKAGGIAALAHAAAYVVGIGLYLTVLTPILDADPGRYLALLPNYQSLMYVWILIAYWVAGFCMVVVALAIYERLKVGLPAMMQITTVLGLIWAGLIIGSGNLMLHDFGEIVNFYSQDPAQAETVWLALMTVENGITSGNELIGGLWILLLSWAALRVGGFNQALNYLGLVIGVAGIASIVPAFTEVAVMIFGLSMIVWFAWVGIIMLRSRLGAVV
ncbi:MAG: DUF4386 family protein [Anaerolineae bacterium]|nr:DUF4386 family protein [Anaerolineae bacterium]